MNLELYATYMLDPIIDPFTGCWTRDRVGVTKRDKRMDRAVWTMNYGPIPEGLCICHKCNNSACWNPSHLFKRTHQDNADDRKRKALET